MAISNRTVTDTLTAAHYNEIRNKIVQILGTGAGDYGYGQATTSSTVAGSSTQLVQAVHMAQLRTDIVKAYVHITSSAFNLTVPTAFTDIILATASGADYNETHNAYIEAVNYCETNRYLANPAQMTLVGSNTATLSFSDWNGTRTFNLSANFGSTTDDHRWFFNAGGEIRFYTEHTYNTSTYPVNSKPYDWQQFLANKVDGTGFGPADYWTAVGNGAGGVGRRVYSSGSPGYDGTAYTANYWQVRMTDAGSGNLNFNIDYVDADQGNTNPLYWNSSFDETVNGTTTLYCGYYYPTGSTTDPLLGNISTVQLPAPTFTAFTN